jgi:hypothetical protein
MKIEIDNAVAVASLWDGRRRRPINRALIAELVRFARPPGLAGFKIKLAPAPRSGDGRTDAAGRRIYPVRASYWSGLAFVDESRIFLRIPIRFLGPWRKPYAFVGTRGGRGYQGIKVYTAEEALLNLLAHELRHLWQRKNRRGRVWGARGLYSERDADSYSLGVVRRWRRRVVVDSAGNGGNGLLYRS